MAKGAPKGHPRYGGRAKGTPNRRTQERIDRAIELGIDPFDVLLYFAAGDWKSLGYDQEKIISDTDRGISVKYTIEPSVRAKCAAEACRYLYPVRKSVEISENPDKPIGKALGEQHLEKVKLLFEQSAKERKKNV